MAVSSSYAEVPQLFPGHTPLEASPNVQNDATLAHVDSTLAAVWLMTGVIKSAVSSNTGVSNSPSHARLQPDIISVADAVRLVVVDWNVWVRLWAYLWPAGGSVLWGPSDYYM